MWECPICHRWVADKWCDNRDRYWRISARGTQGGIRHDTAGERQPVRDSANVGCRSHTGRWQDRYTSIMPAPAHSFPPDPKHPDPPNLLTWHALFYREPHYDTRCRHVGRRSSSLSAAERYRSRSLRKWNIYPLIILHSNQLLSHTLSFTKSFKTRGQMTLYTYTKINK